MEKPVLIFCKLTLFTGQRTLVLSDTQLEANAFWLPFTLNLPIERRMEGFLSQDFYEAHFPLEILNAIICKLFKSWHFHFQSYNPIYFSG